MLPVSAQMNAYGAFTAALAHAEDSAMRARVSEDFQAVINPNDSFGTDTMDFAQFANEIERQQRAFSDFGRRVDILEYIEDGNRITVAYEMTVTFDGLLVSRSGESQLPPTGQSIVIRATDTVTFTPQLMIQRYVVESNMGDTVRQMAQM